MAGQASANQSELVRLIEVIAKCLVDFPDQVSLNEVVGENTTVIELKVAKQDLGKIIGKQGRTAQAIRTVLNGASTKLRKRTVLEILE
ncbi:MAG: KH domain-containing protein [Oligoflexia bacterium]